ncbi:MAG: radical SAM protein [Candidatus Omnitrophica bacterium]|nr:radical SAM protein [Candidatus Omnitrophota bacterium]
MSKIILFNSPSRSNVYLSTNVKVAAPSYPSLTLATLAGALSSKHGVRIVDLEFSADPVKTLLDEIKSYGPDFIGASASTPDYLTVRDIMRKVKDVAPSIITIVGGVHVTTLSDDAANEACFDIVVVGEGDKTLPEILSAASPYGIPGTLYKDASSGRIVRAPKRQLIRDINELPCPDWGLFELKRYRNSRISSRKNPVGLMETSRGCAFQCNFCNKLTFGSAYRPKNPKRVVDEMEHMLKCGFREIHIIDDSFTQDMGRAKDVCREILRRGLKFPWVALSGLRVDLVDLEFFRLAKRAGCWMSGFGIESGDQEVLDRMSKGITLSQVERAVALAKKAGIETFGFFILGLLGETEVSMRRTIDFAKRLPLDIAKFDICIPYPGTPYYNILKAAGRIKSENWSKYVCHQTEESLFNHHNLSWGTIESFYKKSFMEFYLRPSYILRRFFRSLRKGDILNDIRHFLGSKW